MNLASNSTPPGRTMTNVTCTKCGKAATVPFTPTPGRPVFCRDCFSKPAPGGFSGGPRGSYNSSYSGAPRARPPPIEGQRKRMMAQGRKTHFIYDAREALVTREGGMEDKDARAFLEGLFARGARTSTEAAQEFLEQKVHDGAVTHEQAIVLGRLIDKYSFVR